MEIRFKQNDIALKIVFDSENFVYQFFFVSENTMLNGGINSAGRLEIVFVFILRSYRGVTAYLFQDLSLLFLSRSK